MGAIASVPLFSTHRSCNTPSLVFAHVSAVSAPLHLKGALGGKQLRLAAEIPPKGDAWGDDLGSEGVRSRSRWSDRYGRAGICFVIFSVEHMYSERTVCIKVYSVCIQLDCSESVWTFSTLWQVAHAMLGPADMPVRPQHLPVKTVHPQNI